jgi:hypothetical protein
MKILRNLSQKCCILNLFLFQQNSVNSSPPFYTSLNVHGNVLHNCLMDSGASHNLMLKAIMDYNTPNPLKELFKGRGIKFSFSLINQILFTGSLSRSTFQPLSPCSKMSSGLRDLPFQSSSRVNSHGPRGTYMDLSHSYHPELSDILNLPALLDIWRRSIHH